MREFPVRTGWALAAAAALGLAGAAPAPPASQSSSGTPVSAWHAKGTAAPALVPLSPSHACLAEMQVELAWLSDSITFPYPMAARIVGTSLDVGGLVSTEAVRQRALYLAREYSGMNVVDHLHVQPSPPPSPARAPDGVLARNAASAVSAAFAKHSRAFTIKADAAGCLTISGTIPSYEEKLAVSRRLSRLAGCTCVVNDLEVATATREGKPWVNVSADGIQQVPVEIVRRPVIQRPAATVATAPQPAKPAGPKFASLQLAQEPSTTMPSMTPWQPASKQPPATAPMKTTTTTVTLCQPPSTQPPAAAPMKTTTTIMTPGQPPSMQSPTTAPMKTTTATPPVPTAAKPSEWKPIDSTATSMKTTPTPRNMTPPAEVLGIAPLPAATPNTSTATAAQKPPVAGSFTVPVSPYAGCAPGSSTAPVSPYAAAYFPQPARAREASTTAKPIAATTASTGVVPASYQAPRYAAQPVAVTARPSVPVQQSNAGPMRKAEFLMPLRQQIETTCGGVGHNVEIVARSPTDLEVRVTVQSKTEGSYLASKILAMPELAPYRVILAITWQ